MRYPALTPFNILYIFILPAFLLAKTHAQGSFSNSFSPKEIAKSVTLPPCQACKALIGSFEKGMERTARSKFDGGDAAWEEEKMKSYKNSEVRLVEIQEGLCTELQKGSDQCHKLAEDAEHFIEDWWNHQDERDLFSFICIESLKMCCPNNHYGAECKPCPGYPAVCTNNGKCKGNGTRKGNGACVCDNGYIGDLCDSCAENYYVAFRDEKVVLCSPCHHSCLGSCTQAGSKGCVACKPGYSMNVERGCVDIDECVENHLHTCGSNQFCVNNEGSFRCLECDSSCNGCDGDGPDYCRECAKGYFRKDNLCIDEEGYSRDRFAYYSRYMVYIGLTVATCIIFQNNHKVAYAIGLAVAMYITASEHFASQGNNDGSPKLPSSSMDLSGIHV